MQHFLLLHHQVLRLKATSALKHYWKVFSWAHSAVRPCIALEYSSAPLRIQIIELFKHTRKRQDSCQDGNTSQQLAALLSDDFAARCWKTSEIGCDPSPSSATYLFLYFQYLELSYVVVGLACAYLNFWQSNSGTSWKSSFVAALASILSTASKSLIVDSFDAASQQRISWSFRVPWCSKRIRDE